jgi:DNA repair exonuclease SbcCD ATPase subunit
MDLLRLLDKAPKKYSIADVQAQKVDAVSVILEGDLQELLTNQVKDRTAQLAAELKHMKTRLAELEADRSNSGGIERAAAEAALEAEAKALEAQAAAELRAEQAEAKLRTLEAKPPATGAAAKLPASGPDPRVAELEKKLADSEKKLAEAEKKSSGGPKIPAGADPAKLEAAEKRLADSEKKLADAEARAKAAEDKVSGLEADLAKAKSAPAAAAPAADDGVPAEPATPDDHKKARRLVDALLDDVVGEDEAKAKASFGKKSFRTDFGKSLEMARKQYVKRVKAHVRGEKDHWDEAISALEAKG